MTHQTGRTRPAISMALSIAAVLALMTAFAIGKKTGLADPDIAKRGAASMIGLILVVTGNFVPKMHLFQSRHSTPSGTAAVDRFAGWMFVLFGFTFAVIWLFAPLERAALASPIIGVVGFLLVLARWLIWQHTQQTGSTRPALTPKRLIITILLVSIFWTFAIFFADAVWGDTAAQWLAVIFSIALGGTVPFFIFLLRGRETAPHE